MNEMLDYAANTDGAPFGVNEWGQPMEMTDCHGFYYWFLYKNRVGYRYNCMQSGCPGYLLWYPERRSKQRKHEHTCGIGAPPVARLN
jgi:hypothetical protein